MKTPPKSESDQLLESFMKEFFPFAELRKVGFFTPEMKGDYQAQADKVCEFFGFKTVYEYGAETIDHLHLTYAEGHRPRGQALWVSIPSIYE